MLGAQAAEHWGSLGIQPHAPEQQEQQQLILQLARQIRTAVVGCGGIPAFTGMNK